MGKSDDIAEWIGRAFEPPDAEYVVAVCKECDREVWKSTTQQPFGMAESCEDHWPLSSFTP